jgi:hypothetical protein
MKPIRSSLPAWFAVLVTTCFLVAVAIHAQVPSSSSDAQYNSEQPANPANLEAERERIWNSPDMLRARAWLQDYCSKSAKVTPEQGRRYMQELANMTPSQMELWLLKHDHAEQLQQQQYAFWQQAHAAGLSQALAANRATQQAYAAINREQSEAAGVAQQQIEEQSQAAQAAGEEKQLELNAPYGPYGTYAYPGYGGIHYHFHLYPNPYPY